MYFLKILQTLSIDVKVPAVPICLSTCALTELAWIIGGFQNREGEEEAGVDGTTEVGSGGRVGVGSSSCGRSCGGGRGMRKKRSSNSSSISPLMPVKVIYRRPAKVMRKKTAFDGVSHLHLYCTCIYSNHVLCSVSCVKASAFFFLYFWSSGFYLFYCILRFVFGV